jgi:hypothetical protein
MNKQIKKSVEQAIIDTKEREMTREEFEEFEDAKRAYIEYLLLNVRLEDWHGVSDAANDLRVLIAKTLRN